MKNTIKDYINSSVEVKIKILNDLRLIESIEKAAELIINCYHSGGKVLTAGNGGSAADAQHISAEFVSRFMQDRKALNSIALTTNTSILTAVGNDYSHEYVFARQIRAYGQEGDVYVAISTSGNSGNIILSAKEAKNLGLKVIGLTGSSPSKLDEFCDCLIKVPSLKTSVIQEAHIMIEHIICGLVEDALFSK